MSSEVPDPPEIEVVVEATIAAVNVPNVSVAAIEVVRRQRPPPNQWAQAQHSPYFK